MDEQAMMYTVSKFLRLAGISKTTWWRLRKRGEAPKLLRLGSRYYITQESALEWMREREAQTEREVASHG